MVPYPTPETVIAAFSKLTDNQAAYLIRKALLSTSKGALPGTPVALFVTRLAQSSGVNTAQIQRDQVKKSAERTAKFKTELDRVSKLIKRKNVNRAAAAS